MSNVTNLTAASCPTSTTPRPVHQVSAEVAAMESHAKQTYRPPGSQHSAMSSEHQHAVPVELVRNADGTPLVDSKGQIVSVDKILATKPLRHELSSRPGPGNRKLTYLSGEGVTRTLNDIFGYSGWNLDIKSTKREECVKDDKGRYHVAYTATVRLTLCKSGAYKEDCGAGDAIDRSLGTAVANALKASVTDAMKRAARHFGDKLGNSLYNGNFSMNKAPTSLQNALDQYDIDRANTKFGFPKDRVAKANVQTNNASTVQKQTNTSQQKTGSSSQAPVTSTPITATTKTSVLKPPPARVSMGNTASRQALPYQPTPGPSDNQNNRPMVTPQPPQTSQYQKPTTVGIKVPQSKPPPPPQQQQGQPKVPPFQSKPTSMSQSNTTQSQSIKPISARESLESSGLFDLSMFTAGTKTTALQGNNENIHPYDMPRPATSTGRGPMAGKKRTTASSCQEAETRSKKQPSDGVSNPYLANSL